MAPIRRYAVGEEETSEENKVKKKKKGENRQNMTNQKEILLVNLRDD